MQYRVISTDSHVNEPSHLWQERLPPHLRAAGHRLVDCDDGGQGWTFEGRKPTSFGLGAVAGRDFKDFKDRGIRFSDLLPGNYDAVAHLKDQDMDAVDASVMYPGAGMSLYAIQNKELRLASMYAYNDWLVEDFASVNPKRILGLAVIPVDDDVEEAVAELKRSVKKGHKGGLIATWPANKPYTDRVYDPLWAAAQDLGAPFHFHRGIGRRPVAMTGGSDFVAGIVLRYFAAMDPLCHMLFTGVFHRFPGLKCVSAESDFGWLPFFMQLCDDQWTRQRYWSKMELTKEPSEYIREQIYCTFMDDAVGCANLKFTGYQNVMWASDYPHSVTTWPKSREYIERQMGQCTPEERERLLAGNAVRLYQLN